MISSMISSMKSPIELVEKGYVPDALTRNGIRKLLKVRLKDCRLNSAEAESDAFAKFLDAMGKSPLALHTQSANDQHYEVPTEFYKLCLGPNLKYSSCFYTDATKTLGQAEDDMLSLTCKRAGIRDGMKILELGCGWGSLSLWMAKNFPNSQISAVSNSATQKQYIDQTAKDRGLKNLTIITCDMNNFSFDSKVDRVVSVEMFEHMRNYRLLFEKISSWLKDDGKLFFHIFCHNSFTYPFETDGEDDWMGRHFFTGGIMPGYSLPLQFQEHLKIEQHWKVDGTHYQMTSEHWLQNLDRNRSKALEILGKSNPSESPIVSLNRWRMFFMSCAELFGYNEGREWLVGHYLFQKR
jgi:cyclopropane-fatty-acyl-phospholipid synthase